MVAQSHKHLACKGLHFMCLQHLAMGGTPPFLAARQPLQARRSLALAMDREVPVQQPLLAGRLPSAVSAASSALCVVPAPSLSSISSLWGLHLALAMDREVPVQQPLHQSRCLSSLMFFHLILGVGVG